MRQMADEAKAKSEEQKPGRLKTIGSRAAQPVRKVRLPNNRVLRGVGRTLARILGFLVPRYFINSWREVRQVTWPGRRETWRLTSAVFIFAIIFGALVAGVDKVLDIIFKHLVLK
jgi:preprotein translocase SecE subunit